MARTLEQLIGSAIGKNDSGDGVVIKFTAGTPVSGSSSRVTKPYRTSPTLRELFHDNGDGTYSIRVDLSDLNGVPGPKGDKGDDGNDAVIDLDGVDPIADPSSATTEDIATAFNALLSALSQ